MDWLSGDWPKVVIGGIGSLIAYLSYRLSKRGVYAQEKEQRVASEFGRMISLNDRLVIENARLSDANERKAKAMREWGPRWHAQLSRCRDTTDALLAIIAETTAPNVTDRARRSVEDHRNADHIEIDESGE